MFGRRSAAVLIGIAVVVAGAVALAGSSADWNNTDIRMSVLFQKLSRSPLYVPKLNGRTAATGVQ
jgi:hypothetical protein